MPEPVNALLPLAVTIGDPAGVGPEIVAHIKGREVELGLPALRLVGQSAASFRPGRPDRSSARFALDALEQAVALVRSGECGALVTGPVAKSAKNTL